MIEKSKELLLQEQEDMRKLAEEKKVLKTKKILTKTTEVPVRLPPAFHFTGGRDYEMAIKKLMIYGTSEQPIFEDKYSPRKRVKTMGGLRPTAHRLIGSLPAFREGVAINARLQYIPLLQFYTPERILSMNVQQAGKLLSQIEKKVKKGKLIEVNTNIKIGNSVIPQYFRPDQKAEIAAAKDRLRIAKLEALESQKKGVFKHEHKNVIEDTIENKRLSNVNKRVNKMMSALDKTQKVAKKTALVAWKHPITKAILKVPILEAQLLNQILLGGNLPIGTVSETAKDLHKSLQKGELTKKTIKKIPIKIIKKRLNQGGRVSAKPYAVGGKVYSQSIRKPKFL
jgi:hypothetical protein|tara:strand:- start:1217 stop:2236 length:1020 start_codon:yes stop_codon:yes gene_type:complete